MFIIKNHICKSLLAFTFLAFFPLTASAVEAVADGSFEGGIPNSDWTPSSTFGGITGFPFCGTGNSCAAASVARTGDWVIWIGGLASGVTSSVTQSLVIPSSASDLTLWVLRGICDDVSDTLHVSIDGTDIGTLACTAIDGAFIQYTFPLAGYNNNAVHSLEIGGTVGGTNGGHSNFFIDDVSIDFTGFGVPGVPIPTMSAWALILLSLTSLMLGAIYLRRQQQ